ncbi:hypothetical protein LR48_Vigan543s002400 [Vigna angularis]|uniref:WRC domain-containing protein n=2 Tax=Phaseolus angularis TaxID=3914 RepID=A0A0L9TDG3_PHAAN|nr:uncharacterized protein LOC108321586 [Vigna angularis]KAG2380311.1 uncharacterized protein HKW66_Vig0170900 [Vigna angularis]KOM28436.1 hypothetical protein LR48_Vigan543s002400 [Vigna angularis]BAT97971.1 hypothetical protein VIGAN_09156800 [Vigna angularis var. angularis]
MRIRKNAKLSPLLFSSSCSVEGGSVPVETHVCQLNQSPWDVIPFQYDSFQFDHATAPNDNAHSFAAVQSVSSMKTERASVVDDDDDNDKVVARLDATVLNPCQGIDEKGWACKNEAKQGQSFCEQHLSLSVLASYTSKKSQGGTRRVKTRGAGKKAAGTAAASSNPYEFYYYSGFGPSWRKRRGERNGEGSKNNAVGTENSTMAESGGGGDDNAGGGEVGGGSVSEMDNEGIIDYVEDDDDDEEEMVVEDDSGKKRTRKPVKARSLKSLM